MNRRERRTHWQASRRAASAPHVNGAGMRAAGSAMPHAQSGSSYSAINVVIEKLVVRGFDKREASRMAAALERSLITRLGSGTLPDALRGCASSPSVRLAPLHLRRPGDPAGIGEQLAASIMTFEHEARRREGSQ